jgi:predicted PurR-regulated permease PerM
MLEKRIDISTGIIIRTIIILLGLWFLYLVRDVVALLFLALVFTAAIDPAVDWLHRKKVPRGVGVLIIYLILFLIIGSMLYLLIPAIISQISDLSKNFPVYFEKINNLIQSIQSYSSSHNISLQGQEPLDIASNLTKITQGIFDTTVGIFTGLISLVIVLSMTFYLSVKEDGMEKLINSLTPPKHQEYMISLANRMKKKVGKWMQGQILLMLIIFVLDFTALYLLGIPYALILALFAGFFELIPYLGPIISAIPAVALAFLISPITGFMVLGLYIAIQQIENHIITPQVMKKAVGLNPIVVILALLIGAKVAGIFGAILAIPVAAIISVLVSDIMKKENNATKTGEPQL